MQTESLVWSRAEMLWPVLVCATCPLTEQLICAEVHPSYNSYPVLLFSSKVLFSVLCSEASVTPFC